MKHWHVLLLALALSWNLSSCSVYQRLFGPGVVTIQGGFVPDNLTDPIYTDEVSQPVQVPWHPGMTLASALSDVHLRFVFSYYIHIHRGHEDMQVFVRERSRTVPPVPLLPGDYVTCVLAPRGGYIYKGGK